MQETIYTIPIMDAFHSDKDCPFCFIRNKLEKDGLSYFMGGALMESDGRTATNEHGFCREHWDKLFLEKQNVLGLGLTMDTYLQSLNFTFCELAKGATKELDEMKEIDQLHNTLGTAKKKIKNLTNKGGVKSDDDKQDASGKQGAALNGLISYVTEKFEDCILCKRIESNMERYVEVFFHLWKTEEEVRELFEHREGFCTEHFLMLLHGAHKHLSVKQEGEFSGLLIRKQAQAMKQLQRDVNWFTKKFDYKNDDKPWGNSRDAVQRAIGTIHSGGADLGNG